MALCVTNSLFQTKSVFKVIPFDQDKPKNEEIEFNSRGKPTKKGKGFWDGFKKTKFFKKGKFFLPSRKHKVEIDPGVLQSLVEDRKPSSSTRIGEARRLEERLGEAAMGKTFLLQAGDDDHDDTFRVILQMSAVLMFGGQKPVIKVGNQFAKLRSDTFKENDGMKFDNHHQELIKTYHSKTEGYATMQRVSQWNLDFMENNVHGDRYRELANQVDEAIGYMLAASHTVDHHTMTTTDFWTSREGLPYEHSLTYKDSTSGLSYDCSAHLLWVSERTSQLDGAHIKFLKRIANPIGIKVSDKMDPDKLVKLIDILNPNNNPGRITIITRMGAENIKMKLPNIVRKVQRVGQIVTWVTDPDPLPCSIIKAPSNLKTHPFNAIKAEVRAFFNVHEQEGSYPGGIHLEMTGKKETKCNNGSRTPALGHTSGDLRLNASESLELAFIVAEHLRKQRMASRSIN